MRSIAATAIAGVFLILSGTAQADDSMASCTVRHADLTRQAAGFSGPATIKRLIDADLQRAMKEYAEGDADECLEALDHAAELLAGKY